jgi:hypothetical protein
LGIIMDNVYSFLRVSKSNVSGSEGSDGSK